MKHWPGTEGQGWEVRFVRASRALAVILSFRLDEAALAGWRTAAQRA